MSYVAIIIISLPIILVIFVVTRIVNRHADNEKEMDNPFENDTLPNDVRTKTYPNDEDVCQDDIAGNGHKIDYKAIHDEMYYVEYKLIPQFVNMFKEQPNKVSQNIISIYENLVVLQNHLRKVNSYAFGNISCEVYGDVGNECLAVYEFPKPFDIPLAKYGAVYYNIPKQICKYFTLEFSLNGKYVLGSKTLEGHINYGQSSNLSKDDFIHEVCQHMGVDECSLQPRNFVSRKEMLELDDLSIESAKVDYKYLVVCFYDFNQQSQMMLPILEQLAKDFNGKVSVGVYDVYGGLNNSSAIEDFSIRALPTMLFFANGELVDKHIGACQKEKLMAKIEKNFISIK